MGQPSLKHCVDNAKDRSVGHYWEEQFCEIALKFDKCFTPNQWNKTKAAMAYSRLNKYTLPDIVIWSCPGQHHEIKHKEPTRDGYFGLEEYRYEALLAFKQITNQDIYYTIHNHKLSGGVDSPINKIEHWFTAKILDDINKSNTSKMKNGPTWYNGEKVERLILYWEPSLFKPLVELFIDF